MKIIFEEGVIKTPDTEFNEDCGGIGNLFFKSFKKYSERICLIDSGTDEYDTFSEALKKCTATAQVLQKKGLKKQDFVAICSNRQNLNANVPIIAGQFLGCITFSIDPTLSVDECVELLEQVQPNIMFVVDEAKETIQKAFKKCNIQCELVVFGKEFEDKFLNSPEINGTFEPLFITNLQDTCMIHFSSGTTGTPKPICLSHYYFLDLLCTHGIFAPSDTQKGTFANHPLGSVGLRFANWYWISSSMELMAYIVDGGCRILMDNFDPHEIWKYIAKYHITQLLLTPLQCVDLSRSPKPENVDVSSLVRIATGGYVLHSDYIYALRKRLPGVFVCQIYGMTEMGGATSFDIDSPEHHRLLHEKPNSCGLPVPGLYYKVIDLDTGNRCGPNQPGELYLKGKRMFNGFYNKDSSESFDEEGYFRTGDLVSFDEDFCFFILDRIKAILGYSDWLIYPFHIEKVLLTHPSVYNAVVIGIPHKELGEKLMGVVMLKDGAAKVTEEELVKYVEARVEDHKRLREGVMFVNDLPTTITGKVNRLKTKEMVLRKLNSIL